MLVLYFYDIIRIEGRLGAIYMEKQKRKGSSMKYVSEYMEELVQKAKGIKTDEATSDEKLFIQQVEEAAKIVENEKLGDETPSKETQEIGDEINHETPSKETQKKMGCLAVLATVLNPSNWFSKEDPVLTPEQEKRFEEEDKKWDRLLSSLRIEPKVDKNFTKRFMKEFHERLAAEKRKEKR